MRVEPGNNILSSLPSLSVAAHELKAPIALMRQLGLLIGDSTIPEGDRLSYQKQLIMTADRSLSLMTDLSRVSNLQVSFFPLEPVNPFAVCQEIARQTYPMAKLYNRAIAWPKSRRNILAVGNSRLLERVLANFIDNALKYTEVNIPIKVVVNQIHHKIRLSVRDFGPQLSKVEYRRLLDELEQLKTIRTRPESSGLGIYLASRFAAAMHGEIGLVRHRDGVTFYIDMPISQQMSWL